MVMYRTYTLRIIQRENKFGKKAGELKKTPKRIEGERAHCFRNVIRHLWAKRY